MSSAGQMYPDGLAGSAGPGESLSIHGSSEKLSPSNVNRILMEFLFYIGRAVLCFYPVYLTGYLGLSVSWVLLVMLMLTWWGKNRQWKDARIGGALDFVDNEKVVINKELQSALQMASWVSQQGAPGCTAVPYTWSVDGGNDTYFFYKTLKQFLGKEAASTFTVFA